MAAADCTVFAVKGQAYRVYGFIKDATTGNPISSIGTLSIVASIDGTYSSTYSTAGGGADILVATAVTSHAGRFYIDIPATPMNAYNIGLTVSSNTSNALYATIDIITVDLSEKTDHWRDQTVKRLEDAIMVPAEYIQNYTTQDNDTRQITCYAKGSTSSVLFTMPNSNAGGNEIKGEAVAS